MERVLATLFLMGLLSAVAGGAWEARAGRVAWQLVAMGAAAAVPAGFALLNAVRGRRQLSKAMRALAASTLRAPIQRPETSPHQSMVQRGSPGRRSAGIWVASLVTQATE